MGWKMVKRRKEVNKDIQANYLLSTVKHKARTYKHLSILISQTTQIAMSQIDSLQSAIEPKNIHHKGPQPIITTQISAHP